MRKLPTGEPCAGEPPARFGGRGGREPFPTPIITERTRAGVQAAKQRGVQFGPKPKLTPQQITHARALRAQGEPVPVIAALFKVHRATLYRALAD